MGLPFLAINQLLGFCLFCFVFNTSLIYVNILLTILDFPWITLLEYAICFLPGPWLILIPSTLIDYSPDGIKFTIPVEEQGGGQEKIAMGGGQGFPSWMNEKLLHVHGGYICLLSGQVAQISGFI